MPEHSANPEHAVQGKRSGSIGLPGQVVLIATVQDLSSRGNGSLEVAFRISRVFGVPLEKVFRYGED